MYRKKRSDRVFPPDIVKYTDYLRLLSTLRKLISAGFLSCH